MCICIHVFVYVFYICDICAHFMPILFCCFTCGQRWPNKDVQTNNSKVHGANMGPTWDMSGPDGPHVGPKNLAIWVTVSVQMHLTDTRSIFAAITVVILSSLVNLFHSTMKMHFFYYSMAMINQTICTIQTKFITIHWSPSLILATIYWKIAAIRISSLSQ